MPKANSSKPNSRPPKPEPAPDNAPVMVGIGASAGGIAALQRLLRALPADTGMVFVVIMHLDPDRKSELDHVLQSSTGMPVVQVNERQKVEQNHVYVIPPNKRLLATDSELAVADFDEPRGRRAPIDQFFRSIAEVHGEVVGVILSGGGTDGTVGLKAIKEQGGFLIVQDPADAEHDSMPRSAITTGLIDMILPMEEIAAQLIRLATAEPTLDDDPEALSEENNRVLQKILTLLRARTSHDFSQYKRTTVLRRIARRMQVLRAQNLAEYAYRLREQKGEPEALFRDLLIGVTTFFRNPEAWDALERKVIPKLFDRLEAGQSLRVWAAGCSTGEEAYSLGMVLLEHAHKHEFRPDIQIFASDLDEVGLAKAREGIFPAAISADVSEERLERFFTREGHHYRIRKEVRDIVVFANHSLLRDPPFSRIDLLTCRNLLIYLQRDLQDHIFEIFHYALRPGGYLFLGGSETIAGTELFETVDKEHRIHQARKREGQERSLPLLRTKAPAVHWRPPRAPDHTEAPPAAISLHRQLLEQYAPPSIVVDEQHHVIHISESAGDYLQISSGPLTSDVLKLVLPELRMELRGALFTALQEKRSAITHAVSVRRRDKDVLVRILVQFTQRRDGEEQFALIVFLAHEATEVPAPSGQEQSELAVRQLELELHHTRQRMLAIQAEQYTSMEELKAANEELQSINEEYRSTTEELETSKEELQSLNEELETVNSELKMKLDEVSRSNDDLHNLIISTDIGTLFLDRQFLIKRYTPRVTDLFNLMPGDIGRPLSHLSQTFDYPNLQADAERVIRDLTTVEAEILAPSGRHYLMRIRPYRTQEEKLDGVVITFIDISQRREAEEALRKSEERYRIIIQNVAEYAIFMIGLDGRISTWNTGAQRIFGYTEEEAVGQPAEIIFTDKDRAGGAPKREMEIARDKGAAGDERPHLRKDGSQFWATGILNSLRGADGTLRGYVKVLRDNTERKQAEDNLHKLNETLEERVEERSRQLRNLASRLTMAEQEERRRISRILHDTLQQLLYGVQMKLDRIRRKSGSEACEKIESDTAECIQWVNDAIRTTRQLTVDISPPVLKGEGLTEALQWLISLMEETYGIHFKLRADAPFSIPDEDMRVLLFQISRELLFNAARHSGAKTVTIDLAERDGDLHIRIEDDGCGFDISSARESPQSGFGLFSVKERLDLFDGKIKIDSAPGQGTSISFSIALNQTIDSL